MFFRHDFDLNARILYFLGTEGVAFRIPGLLPQTCGALDCVHHWLAFYSRFTPHALSPFYSKKPAARALCGGILASGDEWSG
jgi:hypothetical protein